MLWFSLRAFVHLPQEYDAGELYSNAVARVLIHLGAPNISS